MGEPRFPPPHGEEIGYRDAGASTADPEAPRPPVPDGPELPRGKRVIANRPDDPDVALAKAFTPPRARRQQVSIAGVLLFVIVVILWVVLQVATSTPRRPRGVSSPPCVGQHC